MFSVNSPFAPLPTSILSPSQTGGASANAVSQITAATNPFGQMRRQQPGQGTGRNVFDLMAQSGASRAAKQAAPIRQEMSDSQANAEWALQRSNANESFANGLLSRLFENQQTTYRNPMQTLGQLGGILNLSDLF